MKFPKRYRGPSEELERVNWKSFSEYAVLGVNPSGQVVMLWKDGMNHADVLYLIETAKQMLMDQVRGDMTPVGPGTA